MFYLSGFPFRARATPFSVFRNRTSGGGSAALTVAINEATRSIRPGDAPSLRSQLIRASMSNSATVAEGAGREPRADFARFVSMAIASASEVEHHLSVCDDLGLIERALIEQLVDRVTRLRRMLFGLRRTLLSKERELAGRKPQS